MFKKPQLKILLLLIVLLMSSGFQCKCVAPELKEQLKPITLNYWSVWGNKSVELEGAIAKYTLMHPNIKINIKSIRAEEYENMLLNAWAEGTGPDIFSVHNTMVPKYRTKIAPMPTKIDMPFVSYSAPLPGCKEKTEETISVKSVAVPKFSDIETKYVKTVYDDIVLTDSENVRHIYGLPLALDTLALFYNVDLLDKDNIPFPPSDWDEFIEDVRLLTRLDVNQNIVQAGAALGTYDNIERSFDIISLLMMQNGGNLGALSSKDPKAVEALQFYLDFANPQKEAYTWNNTMDNSLDAFVEGKLAFFFGYSYHVPIIKAKAPTLNFAVSPMPQINLSSPVNYANYWVETVFTGSNYTKEAWDFILFLNEEANITDYLKKTKNPTALRSLIKNQQEDPTVAPFVSQVLTANSWHGFNNFSYIEDGMKEIFNSFYNQTAEKPVTPLIMLDGFGSRVKRAQ